MDISGLNLELTVAVRATALAHDTRTLDPQRVGDVPRLTDPNMPETCPGFKTGRTGPREDWGCAEKTVGLRDR